MDQLIYIYRVTYESINLYICAHLLTHLVSVLNDVMN
jgi:hypothetical protein